MIVYCKINTPYNTSHNEMKNKESNVIGRDGSVIIFRVKRSDSSLVVGRGSVREKGNPFAFRTSHRIKVGIWLPNNHSWQILRYCNTF